MKTLSKFIFHTLFGWKSVGECPKHIKKYIIIGAPHTHWLDFLLGLAIKFTQKVPANFIGKASLFKPPFGFIFKALGGTPIDRSKSANRVDAIIDVFNKKEQFILALSPEGTRKRVDKWKTGFYHIAKGANVPIVMMTFDFGNKQVKISEPYYLTDNMEVDMKFIHNFYKGVKGKVPEDFNL
ncbi:1-acyl-sn-glycerol-3-phosphate acyltransferase [Lutibacter sp. TH_r2]|uniref:1-acyl-sn-glycerol-3-phosphate acyltransferase n=1 Tax=Lutibacter sp. TH_r2 TaxID=3082083 RepID=UPI0029545B74|nr:1-acyl-sn-glycerol-3-phosphate acyltransferase [Lutibacter sp. TH_r2]MDV7188270.1 1-acyl-sn-glycerol-3-phosphate acyltransferase [Lutibacter sp. TH_r2]